MILSHTARARAPPETTLICRPLARYAGPVRARSPTGTVRRLSRHYQCLFMKAGLLQIQRLLQVYRNADQRRRRDHSPSIRTRWECCTIHNHGFLRVAPLTLGTQSHWNWRTPCRLLSRLFSTYLRHICWTTQRSSTLDARYKCRLLRSLHCSPVCAV